MILTGHLIGIIAMAIMIITVLTTGTLAAAGLLGRRPRSDVRPSVDAEQATQELVAAQQGERRAA